MYINEIIVFYVIRQSSCLLPMHYHKNLKLSEKEFVNNEINFLDLKMNKTL